MADERWIGAIEAGGTKFVCAAGRSAGEIRAAEKHVVATTGPDETIEAVLGWFSRLGAPLSALGVASFGPLDIPGRRISGSTPKELWRGFEWAGAVDGRFPGLPLGFDTDTNGAALAESIWGAAAGKHVAAYVTVGTGIGGGVVVNGEPLHGLVHPELGHMRVPRRPDDTFAGLCPHHGDCLEGLASGPAVAARWGQPGESLPADHPAWDTESEYLALGVVNIITIVSPEVILLGGGVMKIDGLLDKVRRRSRDILAGYIEPARPGFSIADCIAAPALDPDSGILGAYALGRRALGLAPGD